MAAEKDRRAACGRRGGPKWPASLAAGLAATFLPSAAAAQDAASPPELHDIFEAEASVTSDYRYRGVSLTNRRPGIQANLTAAHENGLYVDVAASTMAESEGGASAELGFTAGLEKGVGAATIDVGLTWYAYPGDRALNYAEANVSIRRTSGTLRPRIDLSYAPAQDALGGKDNLYVSAGVSYGINAAVTIRARVGYEDGALDFNDGGGKWDWETGVDYQVDALTFGLAYIDSNAHVTDPRGRNLADAALVASIKIGL